MRLSPNKNLAWRIIEKKAYILNPEKSELHCLDEVATSAWELISKKIEFDGLCDKMCEDYGAAREVIEKDMSEFVQQLREQSLLE